MTCKSLRYQITGSIQLQKFKLDTCNWTPMWSRRLRDKQACWEPITQPRSKGLSITIENFVIHIINMIIIIFIPHCCTAGWCLNIRKDDSKKSLGFKMKNILKPNAVPTIFKSGPPKTKKLKWHEATWQRHRLRRWRQTIKIRTKPATRRKPRSCWGMFRRKLKLVICLKRGNSTQKIRWIA